MTQAAEKLKNEALQLPTEDRAELAYCLISSLDDADIQAAWAAELEQRWNEMESCEVPGTPADQVFYELRKKAP